MEKNKQIKGQNYPIEGQANWDTLYLGGLNNLWDADLESILYIMDSI